jgi:hypothetical protein
MPYCPDCGAEIGDAPQCPLCGAKNPRAVTGPGTEKSCADSSPEKSSELRFMPEVDQEEFSGAEKRTMAWEVLSVAFCIAILVLAAVNFFESRRFSWSLYPIASMLLLWVEGAALLVLKEKPFLRVFLSALAPLFFLVALGFITKDPRGHSGLRCPSPSLSSRSRGQSFSQSAEADRKD